MAKIYIKSWFAARMGEAETVSTESGDFDIDSRGILKEYENTTGVTSITIPDGVQKIWGHVFRDDNSIHEIIMPDSIIEIGRGAFSHCSKLERVHFSRNIDTIPESCFNGCIGLKNIEFTDSISKIDRHAYNGCTGLTHIIFPGNVSVIEEYAFDHCDSLKIIEFSEAIPYFGGDGDVFGSGKSITTVILPNYSVELSPDYQYVYTNGMDLCDAIMNIDRGNFKYLYPGTSDVQAAVLMNYYKCTNDKNAETVIIEYLDSLIAFAKIYQRSEDMAILLRLKRDSGLFGNPKELLTL